VAVVLISSVAAGIGSIGFFGIRGLIFGTIGALIGWVIWAFLAYIIGTKLLPEPQTKSDMSEMMRTIGFAASPGVIRILAFIPFIGPILSFIAGIWMLVAMVIAVRQALDYQSTWRAIGVCIIGFIIYFVIFALIFSIVGVEPTV